MTKFMDLLISPRYPFLSVSKFKKLFYLQKPAYGFFLCGDLSFLVMVIV